MVVKITNFLPYLVSQKPLEDAGSVQLQVKLYHFNTKSNITGLIDWGVDHFVIYLLNRLHIDH